MNRDVRSAVLESVALAAAAAVSFWLTKRVLLRVDSISHADDLVGGMWAVIATVVVCRSTDQEKATAAASRSVGTLVGLVLCLGYLLIFPFHALGLVTLIGLSALVVTLIGRPDAVGVAAITTAVLLVLAAVNPHDAWEQPILRGADTAIGIAVGLGAAWTARVARTVSAAARAAGR
jgi:uncharacterized membrane protein YccC